MRFAANQVSMGQVYLQAFGFPLSAPMNRPIIFHLLTQSLQLIASLNKAIVVVNI